MMTFSSRRWWFPQVPIEQHAHSYSSSENLNSRGGSKGGIMERGLKPYADERLMLTDRSVGRQSFLCW